jgi:hypothetical protein
VLHWQYALLLVAACTKGNDKKTPAVPPRAESASAQPGKPSPPGAPVAIATRWLDAVRDADLETLSSSTLVPFELNDENGRCGPHQMASSSEQLRRVLSTCC